MYAKIKCLCMSNKGYTQNFKNVRRIKKYFISRTILSMNIHAFNKKYFCKLFKIFSTKQMWLITSLRYILLFFFRKKM
jgi:hypothetical protein